MKFFIQTIKSEIKHDFSFQLLESIEFLNWQNKIRKDSKIVVELGDKPDYKSFIEKYKDYCPIGTVEFVTKWYSKVHGIKLKPFNVPESLFEFANRKVINIEVNENTLLPTHFNYYQTISDRCLRNYESSGCFLKSNEVIKYPKNGLIIKNEINSNFLDKGSYQMSEKIEIESEYRCFVFNNELLDIRRYSGDFWIFPNISSIKAMIKAFEPNAPSAYTLDVGISNDKTFVIEVHDFYSCGLYGFNELSRLPYMFWRTHINKIKK